MFNLCCNFEILKLLICVYFLDQRFKSYDKSMKSKVKKPTFRIDFDEEIDFEKLFKIAKSTTLTKATKSKYSKNQTTLPKDLHYEADKLFRVFRKPKLMVRLASFNMYL